MPSLHAAHQKAFQAKVIRRIILILSLLVLVTGVGTFGFWAIEDASPFDALYMSVITLTTVGYHEAVPLSDAGRFFAIFLIYMGVLSSGISIGIVTDLIFEDTLTNFFKGIQMSRKMAEVKGHYIVCGYGSTGRGIVEELLLQGEQVCVVDERELDFEEVKPAYFIRGDARDDDVLQDAGIGQAKGLATTLTEDADNVFVVLSARALNRELRIVSRFKHDSTQKKLMTAGANEVVSPYRMGGKRLALALNNPLLLQLLDASFRETGLHVGFDRIHLPEGSVVQGRTIRDSKIREESMGALIVAVIDKQGSATFNPPADFIFENVAEILVLGDEQQIEALKGFILDTKSWRRNGAQRNKET